MNSSLFPDYNDSDSTVFSEDTGSVYYEIKSEEYPNSINAETLIVAVDGLNDVFKAIAFEANINISLKIKATKEGSFEWFFELWPIVSDAGIVMGVLQFFGIDWRKAKNATAKTFFKISRLMIEAIKQSGENINDFIEKIRDTKELNEQAKEFLIRLRNNAYMCDGIDAFTKPLEEEVISRLELRCEEQNVAEVKKSERKFFKIGTIEKETVSNSIVDVKVNYLSPRSNRWGFESDTGKFWAEVEDEKFLNATRFSDISTIADYIYEAHITTKSVMKKNGHRESKTYFITSIQPRRNLFNRMNSDMKTSES